MNNASAYRGIPLLIFRKNQGFEKLWLELHHVPGYITMYESNILYHLSTQFGGLGDILEIGSFHGKSSISLAQGLIDGRHNERKLICIENFAKQESNLFPGLKNPKENLQKNMQKFGFKNKYQLFEEEGSMALKRMQGHNYGMIFIDSEHIESQIAKEFPHALNAIHQNGIIVLHDYLNPNIDKGYSDWITKKILPEHTCIYLKQSTPEYQGNGLLIVQPTLK